MDKCNQCLIELEPDESATCNACVQLTEWENASEGAGGDTDL